MWRRLSVVAALVSLMAVALALPATAAPIGDAGAAHRPHRVVVLGVPDLRWQDVDPQLTPVLWWLAGRSSVGAMTDRSRQGTATRPAGWVTLNTGTRAVAYAERGTVPDPAVPEQLHALVDSNRRARYDAQVGALGDALHRAGLSVAAVGGPGAVLGAMDSHGSVDSTAPSVATAPPSAGVVVAELPQLYDVDRDEPGAVRGALAVIDREVGRVLAELPAGADLLVVGVTDAAGGPPALHVAMATGPSFGTGLLTSASTGRTGVVQLIDVAPTVLWLVGQPVPAGMAGQHWQSVPGSGVSTSRQVAAFVDLDVRSVTSLAAARWFYPVVAATALLYVATVVFAWTRRRTPPARALGAVVASLPVATYLVQLVPWWRIGPWSLALLTYGFAAALGLAAALTPWSRRGRWRPAAVVGAVTAAVVVLDAATGSPLSLDAPFADNPVIAGRFHGIGNVALALLGAGTLVFSAALAAGLSRRRAAAAIVGLGALAVAVDAIPFLGDDFGGVLALLPAMAVLGLVVSNVRISWPHVLAALGAAVAVTVAVTGYDHSRPPAEQTHLGRFVAQLADGSAWTEVHRKLDTSLGTVTGGWPRWIVVGWIVLAVTFSVGRRRGWLRLSTTEDRRILAGLIPALLVLALLGSALNDSGLEVTAFTFYVAAPLLAPLAGRAADRRSDPSELVVASQPPG
jgi:hypothetical protein